jgi:integrase
MIALPVELAAELALYQRALARAPLAGATRAKYVARVRGFLVWLATTDLSAYGSAADQAGEPLTDPAARDGAVRDWRVWAKTVGRQARPRSTTPAPIDDFYARRGLGAATARREALPRRAPKALSAREVVRYLRAVEHCGCARDTVVALLPFYAGLRIGEVVGLDLAAPTADAAEFALEELEEKCRNTVRATGPIHAVGVG